MYLTVRFLAGESIESACDEACALATRIDCAIEFEFNGVTCVAHPRSYSALLVQRWQEAMMGSDSRVRMAVVNPRQRG